MQDKRNDIHLHLKIFGNSKNQADLKTQTLSTYTLLKEGRGFYNDFIEYV
jgi:imidazolonepropionase-like amidohydrolase